MKSIKLKPIFFPNDDILVRPPSFIEKFKESQSQVSGGKTYSDIDQLKNILKIRMSKKKTNKLNKEEEESVKKLEEWHVPEAPKSPISPFVKKFTFKKGVTNVCDNKEGFRAGSVQISLMPMRSEDSYASLFMGIVAVERLKKKTLENEAKRVTEMNLQMEQDIKLKINKASKELEGCKAFIKESTEKLENLTKDLEILEKTFEQENYEVSMQEAEMMLFSDQAKKKPPKLGEESQYFIKKERFRQRKQEIYKDFHENKEILSNRIKKLQQGIKFTESLRLECKSNLKQLKEQLVYLYCQTLKNGKDVRSDGLRWIIKSLWRNSECIPYSAFPKYFDDDSCFFLLKMAENDMELEYCSKKLEKLRKELKNKGKSLDIRTTRELYKTVRTRLRNISQSSVGEHLDGTAIEWLDENYGKISADGYESYNEINELRERIVNIQEYMKESMNFEIKRITDNYKSSPGDAEKIGLFHLIKCLVGDKVREFNKYTRSSRPSTRTNKPSKTVYPY